MYIVTGGLRKGDRKLSLAAGDKTEKNKKDQTLHDVKIADFDPADRSQKWWHGKDGALHSLAPYHDFVLIERDGKTMMIDHEESFNTHHGAFNSNEFAYDMGAKHWYNTITNHHLLIDVHDPHQEPKKAVFTANPGNIPINAQWDIVYCDSDTLE